MSDQGPLEKAKLALGLAKARSAHLDLQRKEIELKKLQDAEAKRAEDAKGPKYEYTSTTPEVAAHFQVSTDAVYRWLRVGCPRRKATTGRKASRFSIPEVQAWLEARGARQAGQRGRPTTVGGVIPPTHPGGPEAVPGLAQRRAEEKLKEAQVSRKIKELQLKREQALSMPIEEVNAQRMAAISAVKTTLSAVPRKYSDELVGLDGAQIRDRLTEIMREIQDLFAGRIEPGSQVS